MHWTWKKIIHLLDDSGEYIHLKGSKHAIEKECLRVDAKGNLAQTPHPFDLGSALTHPNISTDFSEAQLELITPTFTSEAGAINYLHRLHQFIAQKLDNELLWPMSVPCLLPRENQIRLANYGSSNRGMEKYIYRKGLSHRYGSKMQTLSGIHYNFSFSDSFWQRIHEAFGQNEELQHFISASYLKVVRNYLRLGWLNTYLFGATPAADKSYFGETTLPLKNLDRRTLFGEYATSIRMSHLGYYSKTQLQRPISFNSLESYIRDLHIAVTTPYPLFQKLGLYQNGERIQLNDHILQLEAEHYSRIRPKPRLNGHTRTIEALQTSGVVYVEVRSLDSNPYSQEGIELEQLRFLHLFLIYCLFHSSPEIEPKKHKSIADNQNKVAIFGRKPQLRLQCNGAKIPLKQWGLQIIDGMEEIAEMLDRLYAGKNYSKCLQLQREKLDDPDKTLSAQILRDLTEHKMTLQDFGLELGRHYHKEVVNSKPNPQFMEKMTKLATQSHLEQKKEEAHDDFVLKGYEDMEISTQMVLREAFDRRVNVEILDRSDNILRLSNEKNVAYLKQATKTSKDNLIAYFLMENKSVTKQILQENTIPTPQGCFYHTYEEALKGYPEFRKKNLVIKPNSTNYGIGISFVKPNDQKAYINAVKVAFHHDTKIIVEEFCKGEEYRFLVIGGRVVAICQRIPANVIGDGVHTIQQLVALKNRNPLSYKKYPIKIGKVERECLSDQKITPKSIPKLGKQVFLRRNTNVSTGGDSVDRTEDVHRDYHAVAVGAAKAVDAAICGVDMMIENCALSPDKSAHAVLELNFNPALYLHRYPIEGKKRAVEKDVLDFLGF